MALPSKTFQGFVDDMVAQWAAQLQAAGVIPPGTIPALQQGDALYATMQAVAAQMVFLQALATIVNAVARVSTCGMVNGVQVTPSSDVDSFFAQFNFPRLPASKAEGPEVMSKLTPATTNVLVSPGAIVQTIGGAIQYGAIADTTRSAWNPGLNAYVLAPGQSSMTISVQALIAGAASNVAANALNQLGSPIPGIDTVNNTVAINNGANAESDDAYRARFVNYLNSLARATFGAISSAIAGVGQGIDFNLIENVNFNDVQAFGQFLAVVDNGTGSPPASLILAVQQAIELVRGFTIQPNVRAVQVVAPPIVVVIRVNTALGYVPADVKTNVQNAIAAGIEAIPIGGDPAGFLYISDVEKFALSVAGVTSVQPGTTLINGVNADYAINGIQAPRIPTTSITVNTY